MLDYPTIVFLSHILLIGPIIAIIGYNLKNKKPVQPELYDVLLMMGVSTILYHTYKLISYRKLIQ